MVERCALCLGANEIRLQPVACFRSETNVCFNIVSTSTDSERTHIHCTVLENHLNLDLNWVRYTIACLQSWGELRT